MPEHVTTNVQFFCVCALYLPSTVISCFVHGSNITKELPLPLPHS